MFIACSLVQHALRRLSRFFLSTRSRASCFAHAVLHLGLHVRAACALVQNAVRVLLYIFFLCFSFRVFGGVLGLAGATVARVSCS